MTFVDFASAQLRKLAEAANQDEPGVWYSDPNMLAMRTQIPCVDADFICACTPTRILALLDAAALVGDAVAWVGNHKSWDGITLNANLAKSWRDEGCKVTPLYASPPPAPKVGDGFVSVPKFVCERGGAGWALWVENDNRRGNRPYIYSLGLSEFEEIHMKGIARALNRYFAELAAAPAPVVAEAMDTDDANDVVLSALAKEADTAPERDPRNET